MELAYYILIIVTIYFLIALLIYIMLLTNILVWRSGDYTIPFGLTNGSQVKKHLDTPYIRYWRCDNDKQVDDKWVILFHSWGRNSARMVQRGTYYWDNGYSIIMIDALSHGQSEWRRKTAALWYAEHAIEIVKLEGIENPVIHGLSFGSIAATIFASKHSAKALVVEALMNNLSDMFYDFMKSLPLPTILYGWVPKIIMRMDFPWEEAETYLLLPRITSPVFLIHGAKDSMFAVDEHFRANKVLLNDRSRSWVVPDSPHSKMARHKDYGDKLIHFIKFIDSA